MHAENHTSGNSVLERIAGFASRHAIGWGVSDFVVNPIYPAVGIRPVMPLLTFFTSWRRVAVEAWPLRDGGKVLHVYGELQPSTVCISFVSPKEGFLHGLAALKAAICVPCVGLNCLFLGVASARYGFALATGLHRAKPEWSRCSAVASAYIKAVVGVLGVLMRVCKDNQPAETFANISADGALSDHIVNIQRGGLVFNRNEFPKWVYDNGRVLGGLVRRRAAERAVFEGKPIPV